MADTPIATSYAAFWRAGHIPIRQLTAVQLQLAHNSIDRLLWVAIQLSRADTATDIAKVAIKAHEIVGQIFANDVPRPPSQDETNNVNSN